MSRHEWETVVKPLIMAHNFIDDIELISHDEALKIIDGESDDKNS